MRSMLARAGGLTAVVLAAALLVATGCNEHQSPTAPATPPATTDTLPDFSLPDVNPNSATAGHAVSPRQFLGTISAWYFGHAT